VVSAADLLLTHDLESNTVTGPRTARRYPQVMMTAPPTFLDTPLPELAATPLGFLRGL
jgi:hypothetical protein